MADHALGLEAASLKKYHITVIRNYKVVPAVNCSKVKVMHILINLIKNAKESMLTRQTHQRMMHLEVSQCGNGQGQISVVDNGSGISASSFAQIFQHGFTTKHGGHGFGLHYCANAANEMGGTLVCQSEGIDKGATFTLSFGKGRPEEQEQQEAKPGDV